MTRYWRIRAGSGGRYWDTWKREKIMTVGWDVGDLEKLDWEETSEEIEKRYDEGHPGGATGIVRRFAGIESDGIKEGDLAIILGSGTVLDLAEVGEFEYNPDGIPEHEGHAYWRRVKFHDLGPKRIRDLPEKFQMYNEYSLHSPKTLSLFDVEEKVIDELIEALKEAAPVDLEEGLLSFDEDAVQRYIKKNFKDINTNFISIEREYQTKVGYADFLAREKEGYVVIEVKVGTAQDSAVGQLLGYMNSIRKEKEGKVRGILVAEGFTDRVKEAFKSDDVTLAEYKARLVFSTLK